MTICYGSTRYSCTDFVIEDLTKRKDKGENHPFQDEIFKPASYLAAVIWDSIGDNLKSARIGMDYLQTIATIVAKEQLPVHWVTPVGFPVYQSYPEMKSKRVKAMLMGEVIKPRINTETDLTDKLRMGNGVAPNVVHSVDSAAMMKTVNTAYTRMVLLIFVTCMIVLAQQPVMLKHLINLLEKLLLRCLLRMTF
jgi:DNA-directed RNA polymerase